MPPDGCCTSIPHGSLVGDGCTAYMRYENKLRSWESAVGSVVGADGGVDAVRRSLYRPMRFDQLPDFVLPLSVVEQGYRAVYVPEAVLEEETLASEAAEYRMRVRVALRALWALWDKRALLNPVRFPLFSWQLASHKLLRYLSFAPLAAADGDQLAADTPGMAVRGARTGARRGSRPRSRREPRAGAAAYHLPDALLLLLPAAELGLSGGLRALCAR